MSTLSCRGWNIDDSCEETDKHKIIRILNDITIAPEIRFTALYIAVQGGLVSFGKFEEVCDELCLFGDLDKSLTMLQHILDVK